MNEQQNAVPVEEKRICKKCLKKLPNKTEFCMYCGTDNAATSVQVEYEKQNNERLKKYKVIDAQKHKPLWYVLFLLLIIDVIVINVMMIFNQDKMFVEVNSARFQNYEKSYYLDDAAYLAYKNNRVKIIGKNRQNYLDVTSEIQKHNIRDVQEVNNSYLSKTIYMLTDDNVLLELKDSKITKKKLEVEYNDVYEYLNYEENNCTIEKEYAVLAENIFYFDPDTREVYSVTDKKYNYVNNHGCYSYQKRTVLTAEEINLKNPEVVYSSKNGEIIVLKDKKEVIKIESGIIKERVKEYKVNDKTIKVGDIKKIIYKPASILSDKAEIIVIDNKDGIHEITSKTKISLSSTESSLLLVKSIFKNLDKDSKINLVILLILLIGDFVFLYKMSDNNTFSKCLSMSGLLMIEMVLYTLIRGEGYPIANGKEFLILLETLFISYLLLLILSMLITQIAELVIKLLDFIKYRNIFSYILIYIAIICIFFNILLSGANGVFFAVFALGTFWAYFTETEEIDIDLFIREKSIAPIIILSIIGIVNFLFLLKLFHISNYIVFLILLIVMFALYLTVRPSLTKKEISGKTIKSLIVMIMYLAISLINQLLAMNLFIKLQSDYDRKVMGSVLLMALTYVLYLVVTFTLLAIISLIFRMIHKIIKSANKKTNSVVQFLIFIIIATITFTSVVYFFPEIINLIHTAVNKIYSSIPK